MIAYLYFIDVIFALFAIYRSKQIYGTYINHYLIFNVWWLFTLLLTFDSPNYPPIHEYTYSVFLFGLLVFNVSILLYKKISFNRNNPRTEWYFDIKHRRILELFVLLCYLPMVKDNIMGLIKGEAFWLLRKMYSERDNSYLFEAMMVYICSPISQILFITAYYKYYTNLKKNSYKINLFIAVVLVICSCFSSGGRTGLINFVVLYIIICFCYTFPYYREVLNFNAKFKPILLAIPVFAVLFLTISRNLVNDNVSLVDLLQFSYGLYGGLLDYYLCGDGSYILTENTYGLSTFEGIYLFINYPFKLIFGSNLINYTVVDDIIQDFVFLTDSEFPVNAHVSMFFRFIRDWGSWGIIIGPILMSLFYHVVFKIAARKQVHLLLYFFMLMQINYTTFDNAFCKNTFVTFLLWYFLLIKFASKKKKVEFK